jgi:geranylgeranyl reductase family protein
VDEAAGFLVNTERAMQLWDAIIVGAGPAGCAAGYDLAAAGRSVLLLDRADFPRPKACAGGLTRKTLRALRYSVAAVTRATVRSVEVERGRGASARLTSRNPVCAMTVRQELDDFCLGKTLAAGARFVRMGAIAGIDVGATEIVVRSEDASFRGRFLVGADGVHSRVRQLLNGERPGWFRRGFALEAEVHPTEGAASGVIFDFAPVRAGYGWIFPKRDHLNIGLYTESTTEKLDRARLHAWIRERVGEARVESVTGQYLGFGAEDAGPTAGRSFLVGDAGGFADPLTGEGIHGAIASGQAASAAIESELSGRASAAQVFADGTEKLRQDLRFSAAGARWFYGNPERGFGALTNPLLRRALIDAYADGMKIAALASTVRRVARWLPRKA